jgi:hypothetical protein
MSKAPDHIPLDSDLVNALRVSGWTVVPTEATDEMLSAAFHSQRSATTPVCETIWNAMIEAAPKATL